MNLNRIFPLIIPIILKNHHIKLYNGDTRLDEKEIEELNQISKKERIDRSLLIRKFLLTQIEEYKLKEVGENYRKGLVSLAEAAVLAKVSIYK